MSSIGVFRKVDMDEKSYLIYTSPDETLAMSSGGDDLSFQPLFLCPRSRLKIHELNLKKVGNEDDVVNKKKNPHPYTCSPHFPGSTSGEQEDESFLHCDDGHFCKLPVVPLFWCNSEEPDSDQFACGACTESTLSTSYYACLECEEKFHKECVESPLEIKYPSHPFHSLRLFYSSEENRLWCNSCWMGVYKIGYHCSTCNLGMHSVCAMKTIPFVLDHPKSHPHPLTFFPAQASLVCNVCATIQKFEPTYICVHCVFAVHKECIDFPHVIRISRHKHRISFTLSLPSGSFSCAICWQQVDNNYGAYSCKQCDAYFIHSNCALHDRVWDKRELEGVPEEEDMIDDGEPFQRIADGIILHPFHSHQLRLESNKVYDINKYCRGCALPTSEDQFYSCMECDFIIHESCANAPRMIRHPLYPYPLTLYEPSKHDYACDDGYIPCQACGRPTTGFFYSGEGTVTGIDLRCASITEPFEYQGHEHPLFLPPNLMKRSQWIRCHICKYESHRYMLTCKICYFNLCFRCASLPNKVKYKHDSHLLTICDGKETSNEPEWCENCEGKIEGKETGNGKDIDWSVERQYYKCNDCCTALHVQCLLGIDMFMRPCITENNYVTFYISFEGSEDVHRIVVRILLNNSLSRPICDGCERRCPFPGADPGKKFIGCKMA